VTIYAARPQEQLPMTNEFNEEAQFELVDRLTSNETSAWEEFVDESNEIIAMHKKHLADNNFKVDDLLNELYVYLSENDFARLRAYRENGKSFKGFIYHSARACKSRLLYRYSQKRDIAMSDSDNVLPHTGHIQTSPSDNLEGAQTREQLNHAFQLLWQGNSQRAFVYLLRRKLELSSKQVSQLLGIERVNTVDVTLRRAEQELRSLLEEMGMRDD
jgi:RNA polymerase sigma factor (sigma-70 family)